MTLGWHSASWRERTAAQMPVYADQDDLERVEAVLRNASPVVLPEDAENLKNQLAEAARGRALLLQGGDCAELFGAHSKTSINALASLFDAMARNLAAESAVPVVQVARIAGQYGKPRTIEVEHVGGRTLPVWRGEIINDRAPTDEARAADPQRMLLAHAEAVRVAALVPPVLFTSHEALLLPYEEALVRTGPDGRAWSVSGHFLWAGERTRQLEGAHVEFLSGIANPIGVKCGPALDPDALLRLCEKLDPGNEPGRLTLIIRHGADEIARRLPLLMRRLKDAGRQPLWISDPMHGNTVRGGGLKLRRIETMASEARRFAEIALAEGVWPGGLHLEMTAESVGECVGEGGPESQDELGPTWTSACDPRLNGLQARAFARDWGALLRRRVAA